MVPSPPPCELCHLPSNLFCPPDNAFLCWNCDAVVHSANFLVARHRRAFLCRSCAFPTPLLQSGPGLASEIHFCGLCSQRAVGEALEAAECETSSITYSELCSSTNDACCGLRSMEVQSRYDTCSSQNREALPDLLTRRDEQVTGAMGRGLLLQAEFSSDESGISSPSISAVDYEAPYVMGQEVNSAFNDWALHGTSIPSLS